MDDIGVTAYELRVTHDLVQRDLFTRRIEEGLERLRSAAARAPNAQPNSPPTSEHPVPGIEPGQRRCAASTRLDVLHTVLRSSAVCWLAR
jgi:hypothetical protein